MATSGQTNFRNVPYGAYLRWVWPLVAGLIGLTVVVLLVGAV